MSNQTPFWKNRDYYRNLLRLEETAEGVRPVRFTQQQLDHFAIGEVYRVRSLCPAGVSIALMTNAEWLELELKVDGTVRTHLHAMATVNDRWTSLIGCDPLGELPRSVTLRFQLQPRMPEGSSGVACKVEVFLPQYAWLTVTDVRLTPGASVAPAEDRPSLRLLCLGDSITQGADSRNPAGTYPVRLARLLNAELLNQGVGGHDFDPDSFDPELPYEPDLITIAYGINDWAKDKTAATIAANATRLLERLTARYSGVPVLLATPIWYSKSGDIKASGTVADVRTAIADAVGGFAQVRVVDGLELVPPFEYLYADGLHPTDEGFGHYAAGLYKHALHALGR
ncbi:SGNH/GDSL hydrolase family protein [Paenibacillus cymbidii]|uniref:SGNH/GDSL hydrolase family protein n=1 Tax=Paenibacillus cymbidii TaxID=1639034 RepID=UPI001080F6B0|nr:SGNH/GDSL hydrolase family protein [Paenibacillus cymbidii]